MVMGPVGGIVLAETSYARLNADQQSIILYSEMCGKAKLIFFFFSFSHHVPQRLHLPPDLSDTVGRSSKQDLAASATLLGAGCSSMAGGKRHLDFQGPSLVTLCEVPDTLIGLLVARLNDLTLQSLRTSRLQSGAAILQFGLVMICFSTNFCTYVIWQKYAI